MFIFFIFSLVFLFFAFNVSADGKYSIMTPEEYKEYLIESEEPISLNVLRGFSNLTYYTLMII